MSNWQHRAGELANALDAMIGYLRNAKIDLETGCPKATAIRTIEGGIRKAHAALVEHERALASMTLSSTETASKEGKL